MTRKYTHQDALAFPLGKSVAGRAKSDDTSAPRSRSEEFSIGLRRRAEAENWNPGEVEAMELERTRSRRD